MFWHVKGHGPCVCVSTLSSRYSPLKCPRQPRQRSFPPALLLSCPPAPSPCNGETGPMSPPRQSENGKGRRTEGQGDVQPTAHNKVNEARNSDRNEGEERTGIIKNTMGNDMQHEAPTGLLSWPEIRHAVACRSVLPFQPRNHVLSLFSCTSTCRICLPLLCLRALWLVPFVPS